MTKKARTSYAEKRAEFVEQAETRRDEELAKARRCADPVMRRLWVERIHSRYDMLLTHRGTVKDRAPRSGVGAAVVSRSPTG